jgi:ribokinase
MTVPSLAAIGHVEWVTFARVEHIPAAGEIVHARDPFSEPAGGGAVAAVQLARLAGSCTLFTALGDDELAERAAARLGELGVRVHAVAREAPTRTGVTLVDDAGERTITTFGPRLEPTGADARLPWEELADMDAVYFTAGDLSALRAARAARVLVASPRALHALGHGVPLDALVLSAGDETERTEAAREDAHGEAGLLVLTDGARGGSYRRRDDLSGASGESSDSTGISSGSPGTSGSWTAATPPGPALDSYGCGDSFAAGLTYGLGAGMAIEDALDLAARCGAYCLTGRGPYARQLTRAELG